MAVRRRSMLDVDEPVPDPWEGAAGTVRGMLEEREARGDVAEQDAAEQEAQRRLTRMTLLEYVALVPEAHGPIDLGRFPWQVEPLYSDAAANDEEQVAEK